MKAKISTLARKVEELEGKRLHEVQAVTENPSQANPCINFQSTVHLEEHCPIAPSVRDLMSEHANAVGQYKPQPNAPYSNTYNPNWRNHSNLSWKPNPPVYAPPGGKQQFGSSSQPQPSPPSSPIEQAILNLSKVVGNCHTPNPGPTRLVDPNRFSGREDIYWDSLPDFLFFIF